MPELLFVSVKPVLWQGPILCLGLLELSLQPLSKCSCLASTWLSLIITSYSLIRGIRALLNNSWFLKSISIGAPNKTFLKFILSVLSTASFQLLSMTPVGPLPLGRGHHVLSCYDLWNCQAWSEEPLSAQLKGSQPSHFGNIIQIYSNQNRIILAQRQIVEQWSRIQSSEMKLHQFSQMVNKCAKMTHREKAAPSTNGIGKLAAYVKKPNVGPYLASWTNTNLIWIKNLNVWPKSLKLLEENIWEKLNNLKFNNDFLDMTPTSYEKKKRKIDTCDYIKLTMCALKT